MHELDPDGVTRLYQLTPADLECVRKLGQSVTPNLPSYIDSFYEWLSSQPEFDEFFARRDILARVEQLQLDYWTNFFRGVVDEAYLGRCRRVGEVHARIGLSLPTYFAAMNLMFANLCEGPEAGKLPAEVRTATVRALTKQIHLDTALVVETFSRLTADKITEQSRSLVTMSTPVTAIWSGVLLLPIVGIVDARRSQDIMSTLLGKISETRSRVGILDISGVAVVDTAVANHLIKITKATKLMGCECTISGISPAIAQTMVELGIDVGEIRTTATLGDALATAFREVGVSISETR
jgi:rsbT co-antagonist protein RsbR